WPADAAKRPPQRRSATAETTPWWFFARKSGSTVPAPGRVSARATRSVTSVSPPSANGDAAAGTTGVTGFATVRKSTGYPPVRVVVVGTSSGSLAPFETPVGTSAGCPAGTVRCGRAAGRDGGGGSLPASSRRDAT